MWYEYRIEQAFHVPLGPHRVNTEVWAKVPSPSLYTYADAVVWFKHFAHSNDGMTYRLVKVSTVEEKG